MANRRKRRQASVPDPKHPLSKSVIGTPKVPALGLVSFSFRHLDLRSNRKFNPDHWSINKKEYKQYLLAFLNRLKSLCDLEWSEIKKNKSDSLRAHSITWEDTTERNGFASLSRQLQGHQPYQFQLTKVVHGRVHGFAIDNIFYVVWLDPDHKLYS